MPNSASSNCSISSSAGELTDLHVTLSRTSTRSRSSASTRTMPPPMRREGEGSADCRQRPYALFHRPPPPAARSRSRREARRLERLLRNLLRSSWFQRAVGFPRGRILRLVWLTNRFSFEPPTSMTGSSRAAGDPGILAWPAFPHPVHQDQGHLSRQGADFAASRRRIQRHRRRTARHRNHPRFRRSRPGVSRKGGVGAFKEMVRALAEGYNVASTADVPKRARIAGLGIIMLARESGRPNMPFAMATSRSSASNNWDRTTINLPFGRGALVGIEDFCSCRRTPTPKLMEKLR